MANKKVKRQVPDYVLLSVCAITVVVVIGAYDLIVGDYLLSAIALPFLGAGIFGLLFYFSSESTRR
jgi:hypothetical protein